LYRFLNVQNQNSRVHDMDAPVAIYEKESGVARITLNRPEKINAYNIEMRDELYQILEAIRDDTEVRSVLICGEGKRGFCAGADLSEFGTSPSQTIARRVRFERDIWKLWLSIPKPMVCALHGFVIGSGIEMALLCDFRIAAHETIFALPETGLGMLPAAGGTQTVPRAIGVNKALDVLYTNRYFTAEEALSWGLINELIPSYELIPKASALALHLASIDPHIVSAIKQSVLMGIEMPLPQGLGLEKRLALQVWVNSAV
jgi:enoyl-CoA hydratase/carnithine racemase